MKLSLLWQAYSHLIFRYLKTVKRVEFPSGAATFVGMPLVVRAPGARIVIGGGSVFLSAPRANVAGINHRCILAAVREGSMIEIGTGCGLSGATLVAARRITLENDVALGVNASVYDNDFHPEDPTERKNGTLDSISIGPVCIGTGAWISANAMVLKGVTIGQYSIIGAAAVVTSAIPERVVAAGNPARVLRPIRVTDQSQDRQAREE